MTPVEERLKKKEVSQEISCACKLSKTCRLLFVEVI